MDFDHREHWLVCYCGRTWFILTHTELQECNDTTPIHIILHVIVVISCSPHAQSLSTLWCRPVGFWLPLPIPNGELLKPRLHFSPSLDPQVRLRASCRHGAQRPVSLTTSERRAAWNGSDVGIFNCANTIVATAVKVEGKTKQKFIYDPSEFKGSPVLALICPPSVWFLSCAVHQVELWTPLSSPPGILSRGHISRNL